jgi:hypothetical protein
MASIVVASTAFGFGLATTLLPAQDNSRSEISNGPRVASPGSESRGNLGTRSIAGYQAVSFKSRSVDIIDGFATVNSPAIDPEGPTPGLQHANLGRRTREIVSACLMAAAD